MSLGVRDQVRTVVLALNPGRELTLELAQLGQKAGDIIGRAARQVLKRRRGLLDLRGERGRRPQIALHRAQAGGSAERKLAGPQIRAELARGANTRLLAGEALVCLNQRADHGRSDPPCGELRLDANLVAVLAAGRTCVQRGRLELEGAPEQRLEPRPGARRSMSCQP